MSNPTRDDILAAHDALIQMSVRLKAGMKSSEHSVQCLREDILKALPPRPKPTMADVEWDDRDHFLAEAEHPEYGKVIMLDMSFITGEVSTLFKKDGVIYSPYVLPENLTPTGKKYKLVEQL